MLIRKHIYIHSYVSDDDLQHVIIEKTSYYYFVRYTHHAVHCICRCYK